MTAPLAGVIDRYLDLRWRLNPVEGTYHGRREFDGRFAHYDRSTLRELEAALTAHAASLEEAETASLPEEIDRTAALHAVRHDLLVLQHERPYARNPAFHLGTAMTGVHLLLVGRGRPAAHRAAALLARLKALPEYLSASAKALTRPAAVFVEMATAMLPGAVELVQTGIDDAEMDLTSLDPAELVAARTEAVAALMGFGDTLALFEARDDDAFAIGRDLFDRKLNTAHMIRDNADELLRFGQRLRTEALALLEQVSQELAPGEPWQTVHARLRQDAPDPGRAVEEFARAMQTAREFTLQRALVEVPPNQLHVVPTPPFLRALIPLAAYQGPGAFDAVQDGTFFVTLPEPGDAWHGPCRSELPGTALHEGVPGHHLQIVTANALEQPLRRVLSTAAAQEGWALYCETLMAEQGFLSSPKERFFQAHHLLWRALRVILDISLHTRGMHVWEAAAMLRDDLGFDREIADAEARRYAAYPTYQLCYAVGRRDILALRDDARRARGSAFTLRAFHEELLTYGALPTALARWGMGLA